MTNWRSQWHINILRVLGCTDYMPSPQVIITVLCPEWKKWWLKHPNLEIVPPIRAKIVGEKHKLVVVICYLVVVNWL